MAEVSFGEWLKRRRKAEGMTQKQLAAQVSCSAIALRKIEAEERRPSFQIVERFAEIFNIPKNERTAFLRFARGDWRSVPAEDEVAAPWHVPTKSPRSNLPANISSLVGREQAIADIHDYLLREDIRLVTLIGMPGIGKTRLSVETARAELANFPDGVFFVRLAPLDDPALIVLTIVQALGYVEAKDVPARQQLLDGIGGKQMLILLDNCEHLIEDVALLTTDLLSACPRLKILATSRESLRIPGEWLYPVPLLDFPEENSSLHVETASKFPALKLFAERARAVRPDFALNTENIQAVSSICAQLDGLPLAIELIAARMRLMSPAALLEQWNVQHILSADGVRTVSARHKTLNKAIAWSYNLLSAEEQKLFAYLSVFLGGFTLEAAESIFSGLFTIRSISDLIVSLLDKSLLQRSSDHEERRFNMLVTIKLFALDRLRRSGEEAQVRNWHLAYFLDLAEQADEEIHGPAQVAWMDRLDRELDNFRAALVWALSSQQTGKLLRLFAALGWDWLVRWSPNEYRIWLEDIRALSDLANHPVNYARILNTAALLEWFAGNFGVSRSFVEESKAIWLKLGDGGDCGLAEALNISGLISLDDGNFIGALSYFEKSLENYQKCGDTWGVAMAKFHLGAITLLIDEDSSALLWLMQSVNLFHELGDPWGKARVSQRLGELFLKQGNYENARLYFEHHLSLDEGLHFKEGIVVALSNLGSLHRYQREYDHAKQYYEESLSLCREYNIKIDRGYNLYCLGMLALHRDYYQHARQRFADYYNSNREYTEKIATVEFLMAWAAIAAGTNELEHAAKLLGVAQVLFDTIDYRIPAFDRAEFERHIQIAREQLGEERFEALAADGRVMTPEQAFQYAYQVFAAYDSNGSKYASSTVM